MSTLRKIKKNGSVLALIICILAILLVLGVGFLSLGLNSRIVAIRDASTIVARTAADAGLARAVYEMNVWLNEIRATKSISWSNIDVQNQSLENCDATYNVPNAKYDYRVDANDPTLTYYIFDASATGTYNGATRTVYAILGLTGGIYDWAILAAEKINLAPNVCVDESTIPNAPPGSQPLKVALVGEGDSPNITLGNNTTVDGNVFLGDTDITITDQSGNHPVDSSQISGQTITTSIEFPDPQLPPTDHAINTQPLTLTSGNTPAQCTLSSPSGTTLKLQFPNLDISGNGTTLIINGDVSLYITGDVYLGPNTGVQINANSKLTLYLGGNMNTASPPSNNTRYNNSTANPQNFTIYGLATCQTINFNNNVATYAVINAPTTNVIIGNNGGKTTDDGSYYGAIIAKSLTKKNNGCIYYDPRLRQDIFIPGARFSVLRFWEN